MHGWSSCHDYFWFHYLNQQVTSECESALSPQRNGQLKNVTELNNNLQDVIKIINHSKVHALNSLLFFQLCEKMDAEHTCLVFYKEVRWLSKGRSLTRVFALLEPLQRFLSEKQSPLATHFNDTEWVTKLAYLCDIFNSLNKLNLSLQGKWQLCSSCK